MKDNETVCAVVVTYNRKELLIECLDALLKQTRPVDAIYLIDNASTDGTPELLKETGFIKKLPPRELIEPWEKELVIDNKFIIFYVRMHENTGGAGGFYEGVKRAYEKGYDWLWLMDDDVEAYDKALENLLKHKNLSKCIQPNRSLLNKEEFYWDGFFDIVTMNRIDLYDYNLKNKDFTFVNIGCFEGMLIHRDIINKIGFPDKRFFINYDDTVYGLKASQYTNVLLTKKILMNKKIKKNNLSEFSAYYLLRNIFLVKKILDEMFPITKKQRSFYFNIKLLILIRAIIREIKFPNSFFVIKKALIDGIRKKFYK